MTSVLIALGSNLGDRRLNLRRAIEHLKLAVNLARLSPVWETAPVDAPEESGPFLNMVAAGSTSLGPEELLAELHEIERRLGRKRRRRAEPRNVDLDLILHGATLRRSGGLVVPHPRFRERAFVLAPLADLGLSWVDPSTGRPLKWLRVEGDVEVAGSLYS